MFSATSVKPEPAPIDVKVLMIGTRHIYRLLHRMDEDFKKIFKVKAEFAFQTDRSDEEIWNFACFVHKKVTDDDLPHFHKDAVAAVVEHGARLAQNNEKLTTRFADIADVIREAGYWAAQKKAKNVKAEHVDQALEHRVYRVNLIEEALRERIEDGQVLIDLEGSKVGQINGLAVLDLGDHLFGQPSRITATTAMGRAGIIDIDREAEMSGRIHTKGVLILAGFLRERFAQNKPLALTASLCFEQNYGGVDGDSASSTELYALLSSLSEIPLRQDIAVTGSVNQKGEIQPIGGANEKVEGFFDLCRIKGLTGDQGVMIPSRNLNNLMLRKDVVAAVRQGKFHVYAVSTIEEGLEVLTGEKAGECGSDGEYPAGSIYGKVNARLQHLAEEVLKFGIAIPQ
jgi:lon-related putative ATP-dependent protease